EGSDPERTLVVPNGVDVRRFVPGEEGELAPAAFPEVFYVGSFRHLPNILGFQRLCREVMPRVWQRVPNARLRVVAGPRHEYFWSTLAKKGESMDSDPRFEIQGYVEDLRPLYARATVVVAAGGFRGHQHQSAGSDGLWQACGDHAGRVRRA